MDISIINEQIVEINEWIKKASKSLMSFYNEEYGVFWRDTLEDMRKKDLHPTSTNRSFFALYEYLRFLHEEDLLEMGDEANNVTLILKGVAEKYLAKLLSDDPEERKEVRTSSLNEINMFTDSHLLVSVSLLEGLERMTQKINVNIPKIMSVVEKEIAQKRKTELLEQKGGKVREEDEVHDFVTLSIMRGIDVFFRLEGSLSAQDTSQLRDRVQEDMLQLLAFHFAGVSSRFDATELVFSTVLLNRLTSNALQLTERALLTIKEA
ncbi:MAG TPA: hypothetical protein VEP90_30555, partial [Methylomirabilota bacterium]|nr:hypothetical protein [Methylomirabilota bacterium]